MVAHEARLIFEHIDDRIHWLWDNTPAHADWTTKEVIEELTNLKRFAASVIEDSKRKV